VTASSRPGGGSSGHAAPGWPAPACRPGRPGRQTGPTPTTGGGRSSAPTGLIPGPPAAPRCGPRADQPGTRTPAAATATGSFATTVKNAFRSNAAAQGCSAGRGPPRTPDNGPPADHRADTAPRRTGPPNAPTTGSQSSGQAPSQRPARRYAVKITRVLSDLRAASVARTDDETGE
jgi:hypothetical protein